MFAHRSGLYRLLGLTTRLEGAPTFHHHHDTRPRHERRSSRNTCLRVNKTRTPSAPETMHAPVLLSGSYELIHNGLTSKPLLAYPKFSARFRGGRGLAYTPLLVSPPEPSKHERSNPSTHLEVAACLSNCSSKRRRWPSARSYSPILEQSTPFGVKQFVNGRDTFHDEVLKIGPRRAVFRGKVVASKKEMDVGFGTSQRAYFEVVAARRPQDRGWMLFARDGLQGLLAIGVALFPSLIIIESKPSAVCYSSKKRPGLIETCMLRQFLPGTNKCPYRCEEKLRVVAFQLHRLLYVLCQRARKIGITRFQSKHCQTRQTSYIPRRLSVGVGIVRLTRGLSGR